MTRKLSLVILILLFALPYVHAAETPRESLQLSAATGTYTSNPNIALFDGNSICYMAPPGSITDTIVITDAGSIDDLNVALDITHLWIGELAVYLTSPAGTTIALVENIGNATPLGTYDPVSCGCDQDNLVTTLDDESPNGSIENSCSGGAASYTPQAALSAFDGEDLAGTWTLRVEDWDSLVNSGPLNSWSLDVTYTPYLTLDATAACNGTDLEVTINDGDGPFNITGTGPGLPLNNVAAGTHTLTGPGSWTGVTVTETAGDGETLNLGAHNCSTGLSASAACNGPDLDVTITNGDGPFDITGTGPGLPLTNVAAGTHTLTGPGSWTGLTITETGGDTESAALGNSTCNATVAPAIPGITVPNRGLVMINHPQAAYDAPHGNVVLMLPHDADGNGFDTYIVTDIDVIDDKTWLGLFIGSTRWVYVPLDEVIALTELK